MLSLPRPPSKRSKGTSVLTAPAYLYLHHWRQAPFVPPERRLKMTATYPPIHLQSNPLFMYLFARSQLSDKNYSGYHVRSLSHRQKPLPFRGCSLTGPIFKVFIIAVESSLLNPLPVAYGERHMVGSAVAQWQAWYVAGLRRRISGSVLSSRRPLGSNDVRPT